MNRASLGLIAVAIAAASAPAAADEAWNSTFGLVEWETTTGDTVVFSYQAPSGASSARVFLENAAAGLAGARGGYEGYWIEYDQQAVCEASLTDPLGGASRNWGRFEITFVREGFPSDWTARWGYCFEDPANVWVGHAILGEGEAYPSQVE